MTRRRVFIAGAAGAIGLPLVKLLRARGHEVVGTTRKSERAERLAKLGAIPELVDVYDREALTLAVRRYRPDVVIHQLTDLPYGLPQGLMEEGRKRNAAIRLTGTRNLLDALDGMPVSKLVVQSIAFMYAGGRQPHIESDPLASPDLAEFEASVLESGYGVTVLRYGRFYGDRTGVEQVELPCRINVLAAAGATALALGPMNHKVYNVCEDGDYADNRRFISETGWDPHDATLSV